MSSFTPYTPHLWEHASSKEIAKLNHKFKTILVLPFLGYSASPDQPINNANLIAQDIIKEAIKSLSGELSTLLLPPQNHIFSPNSPFSLSSEDAYEAFMDLASSIKESGFIKILLVNLIPDNQSLVNNLTRGMRVNLELLPVSVNLAELGFNLQSPDSTPSSEIASKLATIIQDAATLPPPHHER